MHMHLHMHMHMLQDHWKSMWQVSVVPQCTHPLSDSLLTSARLPPTATRTHTHTLTHTHTHIARERARHPPHGRSKPLWAIWNVVGAGETRYCWLCHIAFAATRQDRACLTARRYDSVSHPPAQQQAEGQRSRGGGGERREAGGWVLELDLHHRLTRRWQGWD